MGRTRSVLIGAVTCIAIAQAQPPAERYAAIGDQIYFHVREGESARQAAERGRSFTFPPFAEIERLTAELHDLGQSAVQDALAAPGGNAERVAAALAKVQGPLALSSSYPEDSNVPYAGTARARGTPLLVAAFAILRGGQGIPQVIPSIEFYSQSNGSWKLAAELGADFEGRAFSIAQIPSPAPDNEAWFLAWGRTIGDTGARMKAQVYSFDGFNVHTVWARDGLLNGQASVASNRVRLEYDEYESKTPERPKGYPWVAAKHRVEFLRPALNGLEPDYSSSR